MNYTYKIKAVSPVFSYGANQSVPEIRAASIRGILHLWFRILGYSFAAEREIFGGVSLKKDSPYPETVRAERAGKLVVRVSEITGKQGSSETLPHKKGGFASPKPCFLPGLTFRLNLMDRLGGLTEEEWQMVHNATQLWLLCGGFGTRSTRGGGSFQCIEPAFPSSANDWQAAIDQLLAPTLSRAVVLTSSYNNEYEARNVITDTIGGFADPASENSLDRIRSPLGFARGNKRKTSPLKLTIRYLDSSYRIVAFWDGREKLTENSDHHLRSVVRLLCAKSKSIGRELEKSLGKLIPSVQR